MKKTLTENRCMFEKEKYTIAFCQRSRLLPLLALLIQEEILLSETRYFGHIEYNHLLLDSMGCCLHYLWPFDGLQMAGKCQEVVLTGC